MQTQAQNHRSSGRSEFENKAVRPLACSYLALALLVGLQGWSTNQVMAGDQAQLVINNRSMPISIGVHGITGSVWQVEYTDQLGASANWHLLGSVTLSSSPCAISDPGSGAAISRFYRATQPPVSPLDEVFYLRLDGDLFGAFGEAPISQNGIEFIPGKAGQAVHLGAAGRVRYPINGNLNAEEGTIQFWVRPDWKGDTNVTHVFFEAGDNFNRGLMISKDSASFLRLIQWGDDPGTGPIETDVERGVGYGASAWQAYEWHHVAVCWKSSTRWLALYVDGEQVRTATNGIHLTGFSTDYFVLGAEVDNGQPAYAAFDEFKIFAVMRTANQVFQDYQTHRSAR